MNAFLRKEIRAIAPVWMVALILAVVPVWIFWPINLSSLGIPYVNPAFRIPAAPQMTVFIPFGLGLVLLAVSTFGQEFSAGTFSNLLVQPVSRRRIWWVKISTLGVALGLAAAAFYVSNCVCAGWVMEKVMNLNLSTQRGFLEAYESARAAAIHNALQIGGGFALLAFVGGLWTTLLFRQLAAAICFTVLAPVSLFVILGYCLQNVSLPAGVRLDWVGVSLYGLAGFFLAHRLFMRAEDVQWTGGVIVLPGRRTRAEARVSRPPKRMPLRALVRKECESHHVPLILGGGLLLLHALVVLIRWLDPSHLISRSTMGMIADGFPSLWLFMPMIVGGMSIAEERKFGTLEGALCLPVSRRLQFFVKFGVVMVLGIFLGGVMPVLVEGVRFSISSNEHLPKTSILAFLAGSAGLTLLSMYASSFTRNTLQALGATAALVVITGVLIGMLDDPAFANDAIWRGPLILLIGVPLMVSAIVLLACRNYQRVYLDWRAARHNFLTLLATLLGAIVATTLTYHRVWEILASAEPSHYVNFTVSPAKTETAAMPQTSVTPKLEASFVRLAVLLEDGRIWLKQPQVRIEEGKTEGVEWGNVKVSGFAHSGFIQGSNWRDVAVSMDGCFAIQADGTLWDLSTVRAGETDAALAPRQFGNDRWKNISAGDRSFLALKSDGTIWEWGRDMVSVSNKISRPLIREPVQVGSDRDWMGVCSSPQASAAIKSDGSIWIWHYLYMNGQNVSFARQPVHLTTLPDREPISVAVSSRAAAAVLKDGTLWLGGEMPFGMVRNPQDGVGSQYPQYQMKRIRNDTNWREVKLLWNGMVAVKQDGTLWQSAAFLHNPSAVSSLGEVSRYAVWTSVCNFDNTFLALAADGVVCQWRESENIEEYFGRRLLGPSRIRATKVAAFPRPPTVLMPKEE